jgi:hypothetical protein
MAATEVVLHVGFAWWLRPYLAMLVFFCVLTRAEPDWVKLNRVINRAIRIRLRVPDTVTADQALDRCSGPPPAEPG